MGILKTAATVAVASSVHGRIQRRQQQRWAAQDQAAGRTIMPINRSWRYHPSKIDGAEYPDFDDAKFQRIVIPHTNVELPWHNFDDKDYEFISTYRRRFKFPPEAEGKRVFVDFEGVMTASTVWINGTRLGDYRCVLVPLAPARDHVVMERQAAAALDIEPGEPVRMVAS